MDVCQYLYLNIARESPLCNCSGVRTRTRDLQANVALPIFSGGRYSAKMVDVFLLVVDFYFRWCGYSTPAPLVVTVRTVNIEPLSSCTVTNHNRRNCKH